LNGGSASRPSFAKANELMGPADALTWLVLQWRARAQAAQPLPWQPGHPKAHAASLFLLTGDWADVAEAARSNASWRRAPQPLLWRIEDCWHLQGADADWPMLTRIRRRRVNAAH
jgi:hypothetical protein